MKDIFCNAFYSPAYVYEQTVLRSRDESQGKTYADYFYSDRYWEAYTAEGCINFTKKWGLYENQWSSRIKDFYWQGERPYVERGI